MPNTEVNTETSSGATAAPAWPPDLDSPAVLVGNGVAFYHAIEFAIVDGFRPLQLDLYLSAEAPSGSRPAIVYFHGGGWSAGSRRRFGRAFREWPVSPLVLLAEAGFVVATVDYRLSGEAVFPAQLHDAKAAVRWLRANAPVLDVDPDRIAAWGESAGAHVALLLGLTANHADLEGAVGDALQHRSDVCAVVDWYGPTDLVAMNEYRLASAPSGQEDELSSELRLLGMTNGEDTSKAAAASPLSYVHFGSPPIQIHHGDADHLVPYAQSVALANELEEAEVEVELVPLPGTDHFWIGAPSVQAIFKASLAFVRVHTAHPANAE